MVRVNGSMGQAWSPGQRPAGVLSADFRRLARLRAAGDHHTLVEPSRHVLRRHLLEYPNAPLPNADSFFFWEKVDFGLKPTIRVNHAIIARGRTTRGHEYAIVAIKQLYATHYFHTALDVSVCIDDGATGPTPGFYLLTIKGSQQGGLTGLKGSILRKVVVDKTRQSLERALASIKRTVERSVPRS